MAKDEEGIKVFVRVRPQNDREKQMNRSSIETKDDKAVIVTNRMEGKTQTFAYDKVAGQDCTQDHVFETVGRPSCEACLEGFNSTVFAYGQTGAGKTFTMQGHDTDDKASGAGDKDRGLIPRVFDYLFNRFTELKAEGVEVTVKASYLEIYNENVTDLLSDKATSITIRDDPRRGVAVEGATELPVKSSTDTYNALLVGSQNRKTGATCMNKESSRSHSVFVLQLCLKSSKDGVTTRKFSRFNLIDLAGSERQKHTNTTGDRLKEANNINRSLSALGNVIMSLANSNPHVPYRDSKLTFILKDSIGGNSKTWIIANISPADICVEETLSTLKFVRFAKLVKNVATVNQDSSGDIKAMKSELERMKALLAQAEERNTLLESGAAQGGMSIPQGDVQTPADELLRMSLQRESSLRSLMATEKGKFEDRISALRELSTQQDNYMLAAKLAIRLKNDYIRRVEAKEEITPTEKEAGLLLEMEEVRKQLHSNPDLARAHIKIQELSAEVERLEELTDEMGLDGLEAANKKLSEELDTLSEGLRMAMMGKQSAENRMVSLMEEVEDSKETVEHLQVVISEMEFNMALKEQANNALSDENNDLKVQYHEISEDNAVLKESGEQLKGQVADFQLTLAKVSDDLKTTIKEKDAVINEYTEFKAEAEAVADSFESKLEAAATKEEEMTAQIESLTAERDGLSSDKEALTKDKQSLEEVVKQLRAQLATQEEEGRKLAESLKLSEEAKADVSKALETSEAKSASLEESLAKSKAEGSALHAAGELLKAELSEEKCKVEAGKVEQGRLSEELSESEKRTAEAKAAHESESQALKGKIEEMTAEATALVAEHTSNIEAMREEHAAKLEEMEARHEEAMRSLAEEHASKLSAAEEKHQEAQRELEAKHAGVVEKLEAEHAAELDAAAEREDAAAKEAASVLSQAKKAAKVELDETKKEHKSEVSSLKKQAKADLQAAKKEADEALEAQRADAEEAAAAAQAEFEQVQARLAAEAEQRVSEIEAQHEEAMDKAQKEHEKECKALEKEHDKATKALEKEHAKEVKRVEAEHKGEIASLNADFDKATAEATEAHNLQVAELTDKFNEANAKIAGLVSQIEDANAEMESAAKAHERELKGLNKLLSSAQSSVEKLTKKIEKSEEDNAGLAERVKELGKELERMAGANSQLEMEAKELQEEVETLKKGIDKAQKQITGLEKANGELTDANKELTGSLKQTQKDAAKAEKAFEKLQGEKDALETVVAEQAEAIEASEEARLDASSRLDAAEAASAKLKIDLAKEKESVKTQKASVAALTKEVTEAQAAVEAAAAEIEETKAVSAKAEAELSKKLEEANAGLASAAADKKSMESQLKKAEKAAEGAIAKSEKAILAADEAQSEAKSLSKKLAATEKELKEVKGTVEGALEDAKEAKQREQDLLHQASIRADAQTQLDAAERKLEKARKDLADREAQLKEARGKVDSQATTINVLKAEAQNIGENAGRASGALERELKSAVAAAASLEREKAVVEEELKSVKTSLDRSRATEKELRSALKREQDMVVQGGKAVRALERQMVYDGVPPFPSPSKEKTRKALSSLPPDGQMSPSTSVSGGLTSRTPMKERLRTRTSIQPDMVE